MLKGPADLSHSLHVAAQPIIYFKGFDDQDSEIGLSANSAILLPLRGKWDTQSPLVLPLMHSKTI